VVEDGFLRHVRGEKGGEERGAEIGMQGCSETSNGAVSSSVVQARFAFSSPF
jgi:hypothetical protein